MKRFINTIYGEWEGAVTRPARAGMVILLSLLFLSSAGAQPEGGYSVRWMGQYPGTPEEKRATLGDRVSRIVFGAKPREVIKPFNVVAADPDHYWILDQGAGSLFEVKTGEGTLIRAMKRSVMEFPSMVGICRLPGGALLFTDSKLNSVFRIEGDLLKTFGEQITLDQPTGIAWNSVTGDIWVVETGAHQLAQLGKEGQLIKKTGGRGTGPGQFNFPTFIWIDQRGQLYVVDSMNDRIQILDSDGVFIGAFGEPGDATGFMARPKGVATDSEGHIYVADALFHAVQIFDNQGRFLYSFGSQGQGQGEFWMPTGLYIDKQDHIYVADSYNARIQVFQLVKNN